MIKLILLIVISFPIVAFGCSCNVITLEEKTSRADFIYFGQITESKLVDKNTIESKLSIIEIIKGQPDTNILKSFAGEYSMCSMYAATGLTYVVYGNSGITPRLSLCSVSTPLLENIEEKLSEIRAEINTKKL